jgi:hypothetical protein
MLAGKVAHMWNAAGDRGPLAAALHFAVLALGLGGLAVLVSRRRWEVVPIVALVLGISVIGGLLLAGTRRNMPVMPLVIALAGVGATALARSHVCAAVRAGNTDSEPLQRSIAHGG